MSKDSLKPEQQLAIIKQLEEKLMSTPFFKTNFRPF